MGAPADTPEFVFHPGAEADIGSVLSFDDYPLNRILLRDRRPIVDVGAHCGAFSYLCALRDPDIRVHAFEPLRVNYDVAERNLARFRNVALLRVALSDHAGSLRIFHAPGRGFAASSSFRSSDHSDQFEDVPVRRASELLAGLPEIGILKLDTEGHELPILGDLGGKLAQVSVIFVEIHSDADRRGLASLVDADFELFHARADMVNRYIFGFVNRLHRKAGSVSVNSAPALNAD